MLRFYQGMQTERLELGVPLGRYRRTIVMVEDLYVSRRAITKITSVRASAGER